MPRGTAGSAAARDATRRASLAATSTAQRNRALLAMSHALIGQAGRDPRGQRGRHGGRARRRAPPASLLDRLELDPMRLKAISEAVKDLAALPDPIGEVVAGTAAAPTASGCTQVRVPAGRGRDDLRGAPERHRRRRRRCASRPATPSSCAAARSPSTVEPRAHARARERGGRAPGLPDGAIQSIESTDHAAANELMGLHGYVDVLIPRGGAGLIKSVVENAKVPVIETGVGNCHVYVHESADLEMAQAHRRQREVPAPRRVQRGRDPARRRGGLRARAAADPQGAREPRA